MGNSGDTNLKDLEAAIGYVFGDINLLKLALIHKSAGDGKTGFESNERLEWLGDRVLGLLVAKIIYHEYQTIEEGGLTRIYNNIVNGENCAHAARLIGLHHYIKVSKSIISVEHNDNVLGDAYEAIIGATYLDGGLAACDKLISLAIESAKLRQSSNHNYKSLLQEWAQKRGFDMPKYHLIGREGPDHQPLFLMEVAIGNERAQASGSSKQIAQQLAAEILYSKVKIK